MNLIPALIGCFIVLLLLVALSITQRLILRKYEKLNLDLWEFIDEQQKRIDILNESR